MNEESWSREYDALLREQGGDEAPPDVAERRAHPRLRLRHGAIWIRMDWKFAVFDVSISGIGFYSSLPFQPGRVITVMLEKAFALEAEVVGCHLMETDPAFMETQYRVHCVFRNRLHGTQFLVLMKQMDDLQLELAGPEPPGSYANASR